VAVIVVAAALAAFAAAYLTGLIIVGDPFSGTWRLDPKDAYGVVIKRTGDGYFFAVDNGETSTGWLSAKRKGRVLDSRLRLMDHGQPAGMTVRSTFEYQPWNAHLVQVDHGLHRTFTKVSDSTWIHPQSTE
jgi:hypothetical protein